jgi:hypothetical protein
VQKQPADIPDEGQRPHRWVRRCYTKVRHALLQFASRLSILWRCTAERSAGEADVTRTWLSVIALGALAAACSDPNRAPGVIPDTSPPPQSTAPAADSGAPQDSAPGAIPRGPMTDNMPPNALDANPMGTPSYVIAPGDPTGRRNAQIPQPGGRPAF